MKGKQTRETKREKMLDTTVTVKINKHVLAFLPSITKGFVGTHDVTKRIQFDLNNQGLLVFNYEPIKSQWNTFDYDWSLSLCDSDGQEIKRYTHLFSEDTVGECFLRSHSDWTVETPRYFSQKTIESRNLAAKTRNDLYTGKIREIKKVIATQEELIKSLTAKSGIVTKTNRQALKDATEIVEAYKKQLKQLGEV